MTDVQKEIESTVLPSDPKYVKLDFGGWPTSMKTLSLSKLKDGSITIYVHHDMSHGDRQFSLSKKDAKRLKEELTSLLETEE